MARKLYDNEGNLIPLCFRCYEYDDYPDCDGYRNSPFPDHMRNMKATACGGFGYDNFWKYNNFQCKKGSEFKTFRVPPIKGKQNYLKHSKLNYSNR